MTAGLLIAEARKRAHLTQAQLAERLGSYQSVVARWESGRSKPDFETVQRAVRAAGFELGVSVQRADEGHDLVLIRRQLRLPAHRRLSGMVEAVRSLAGMAAAARA